MGWGENDRGVSFTFGAEVRLHVDSEVNVVNLIALILLLKLIHTG